MPNITFRELEEKDLADRVRWFNKKEGQLKEMYKIDGQYYDEIVMGRFNLKDKE